MSLTKLKCFVSKIKKFSWVFLLTPLYFIPGYAQKLFYIPSHTKNESPQEQHLIFEDISFTSQDGTLLTGWFIPAQKIENGHAVRLSAKGTVIHFHGNAGNIASHLSFVDWLPKRGFNVFMFDYRGYGDSKGKPTPRGLFEDSNSALNYIRARNDVDPNKIIVFGQSLGGTNAIAAVGAGNKQGIAAVAIEATFYSYSSIANDKFYGAGLLMNNDYSANKVISQISPIPFLLIHSTTDNVVPYHHGQQLFEQAKMPKQLITIEGGHHIQSLVSQDRQKYQDLMIDFFENALQKSQQHNE